MDHDRGIHQIYLSGRAVLRIGLVVALLLLGEIRSASAQTATDSVELPVEWTLVVDGEPTAWPTAEPVAPLDSMRTVAREVVHAFQMDGYYRAHVDTAVVDSVEGNVRLYVERGPRVRIGQIRIRGTDALAADELRRLMETAVGETLRPARLEDDLEAIVARYETAGYPLAQVQVVQTTLMPGASPTLKLVLRVNEGAPLELERITVPDGVRASPRFLAHVAELEMGQPMTTYDLEAIQRRMEATGLFRKVGSPEVRVTNDGGAVLHVPLTEKPPGTFDLALGYLPAQGREGSGQVVGNGQLSLRNLFGGGRTMSLKLDRRPEQVSTVDVRAADPYLFGWPLRLKLRFAGEQRDSTYGKQAYHVAAGYRLPGELELAGTLTREVTRPGQAGTRLQGSTQRIPRATAWFAGLSVHYQRLDHSTNPRRGLVLETRLEQGRKRKVGRQVTTDADTVLARETIRQERLRLMSRVFAPTLDRQVLAMGLDASLLRSSTYDRSDLFRLGGTNTLRGYDEDRFLGRVVGRVFAEYRYQVDRASYVYAFSDLGFVETPDLDDLDGNRTWHPGYGIGAQMDTRIGLVNASYALSPEDASPAEGRVHLGLSVGL